MYILTWKNTIFNINTVSPRHTHTTKCCFSQQQQHTHWMAKIKRRISTSKFDLNSDYKQFVSTPGQPYPRFFTHFRSYLYLHICTEALSVCPRHLRIKTKSRCRPVGRKRKKCWCHFLWDISRWLGQLTNNWCYTRTTMLQEDDECSNVRFRWRWWSVPGKYLVKRFFSQVHPIKHTVHIERKGEHTVQWQLNYGSLNPLGFFVIFLCFSDSVNDTTVAAAANLQQ